MTLTRPILMQAMDGDDTFSYTAAELRAGLVGSIFSREGVIGPEYGALKMTEREAGPNFSIDVAPGQVAVFGDDVSDQGTYVCMNTAVYNLATPQPPATGSRRHRVVARVRDRAHNTAWTEGVYDWLPEIVPDTGAGTPPEPLTATTIGYVTIAAGASSVRTANIENKPVRATVGTADRVGTFDYLTPDYAPEDSNRPLRWRVNSDGWVSLAGFLRFKKPTTTARAGVTYGISKSPLPEPIRPWGYRDFMGVTSFGFVHYAINLDWKITYRTFGNMPLVQNGTWWSFDGCGYLL